MPCSVEIWTIAAFLPFSSTLNVITVDILMVLRYRVHVKRSMLLVFWYQQHLVFGQYFHLYFRQSLPTLQRGLSVIADLLVFTLQNKVCIHVQVWAINMLCILGVHSPELLHCFSICFSCNHSWKLRSHCVVTVSDSMLHV